MVDQNRSLILVMLDHRITGRGLSKLAGIHESRISLIKTGRLIPSESEAARISEALHKTPCEIFKEVA